MNYILYILMPLIFSNFSTSFNQIIDKQKRIQSGDSTFSIFTIKNSSFRSSIHNKSLKDFTLMQLDTNALQLMKSKNLRTMALNLPFKNENIKIELERIQLFDQDFKVMTDKSNGQAVPYNPGLYFSGKIIGASKSTVSLSIFGNEIQGLISSSQFGNLNLGKTDPRDPFEYILYEEGGVKNPILFDCRTADRALPDLEQLKPQIEKQLESRAAGCVAIDFELTLEVYTYFGNSINNSGNWLTTLFAGVKTLYLAEGIDINIKTINIWTTEDGYSDNTSTALTLLRNRRTNDPLYTGNFVHLVRGKACTGPGPCPLAGIAYVDVLCDNEYRFGVSEPLFIYDAYPAYSWSINVLTHELGHNMGSNHTQWCGWPGGPIDNCATQEHAITGEPSPTACTAGPSPGSAGGTIMSYCHNTSIGIKFSNGFGTLPGNVIRAAYNAATCLSASCGGTSPTCTDGIQNGTETGIDCGGTCTPCNLNCPIPVNLSQGKVSTQSSTYPGLYSAANANDGNITSTNYNHTNAELQPWWQVNLGGNYSVTSIEIRNRQDCCGNRIKRFKVFISSTPISSDSNSGFVYLYDNASGLANGQIINLANLNATGQYVKVWVDNTGYGANYFHLTEVKVMGCTGVDPCANNQPPTITLSSPSANYPQGSSFNVNATVNDADGTISSVSFYDGLNLLGTDILAPYAHTINPAIASTYNITARVVDNCNSMTTSTPPLVINTTSTCTDGYLNGSELGVDCGGTCDACLGCIAPVNLSQGKPTSQSTTYSAAYPASKTNDGNITSTNFNHTNAELQPWWEVNLGNNSLVSSIEIRNRQDCCGNRIKRFRVFISSTPVPAYSTLGFVYEYNNSTGLSNGQVINLTGLNLMGQYVRIWIDNNGYGANYLHLTEVTVMGCNGVDPCLNNQPPAISLSSTSTSLPQGNSFTVNAAVNDGAGTVTSVVFYNGLTILGTDTESPFSHTVNPATASNYSITAKAIDNCNAMTTSAPAIEIVTTNNCSDGFQNGTETGIDCGGSCPTCQGCLTPTNVSQGKPASQSTTYSAAYPASKANDGSIAANNFNHTNSQSQPWWEVDLNGSFLVTSIEIRGRLDCCGDRLKRFKVFVSSSVVPTYATGGSIYTFNNAAGMTNGQVINIPSLNVTGRYVRIWADNTGYPNNYLHFAEVKVMGCAIGSGATVVLANQTIQSEVPAPKKFHINLYPNPTKDILNFKYSSELEADLIATVYDINGRQLLKATITDKKLEIARLERGSYFIHFHYKGQQYIHKILKF